VKLRKVLIFLAFLLPISLIVGIIVSFMYSVNFQESAHVVWPIALSIAALLSLFFTWYNRHELKGEQKANWPGDFVQAGSRSEGLVRLPRCILLNSRGICLG
jgi:flagellar biosynthesis protein FliQ